MLKTQMAASLNPEVFNSNPDMLKNLIGAGFGQVYLVSKIAMVETPEKQIRLIRLYNPWNRNIEWKGPWSEESSEWSIVSNELKYTLRYEGRQVGEFWMEFEEFCQLFNKVRLFHMAPGAYLMPHFNSQFDESDTELEWHTIGYHGDWVPGKTSGGCGNNNEALFWTNPQFLISLNQHADNQAILISLVQKNTSDLAHAKFPKEFIQFRLFKILNKYDADYSKRTGLRLYARQLEKYGTSGDYENNRLVSKRFSLPNGNYVIVPSCFDANRKQEFLLRVFTQNPIDDDDFKVLSEHKHDLTYEDLFFFENNTGPNDQHTQMKYTIISSPIFEKFEKVANRSSSSNTNQSQTDCFLM
jgi:hypothetical protein